MLVASAVHTTVAHVRFRSLTFICLIMTIHPGVVYVHEEQQREKGKTLEDYAPSCFFFLLLLLFGRATFFTTERVSVPLSLHRRKK